MCATTAASLAAHLKGIGESINELLSAGEARQRRRSSLRPDPLDERGTLFVSDRVAHTRIGRRPERGRITVQHLIQPLRIEMPVVSQTASRIDIVNDRNHGTVCDTCFPCCVNCLLHGWR